EDDPRAVARRRQCGDEIQVPRAHAERGEVGCFAPVSHHEAERLVEAHCASHVSGAEGNGIDRVDLRLPRCHRGYLQLRAHSTLRLRVGFNGAAILADSSAQCPREEARLTKGTTLT